MLRRRRSYLCLDRSIQAKRVYGDRHSFTRIRTLFPGKLKQFTRTRLESFVLLRTAAAPSSTPLSEPEALRSLPELRRHWTQGTRRTRRGDNADRRVVNRKENLNRGGKWGEGLIPRTRTPLLFAKRQTFSSGKDEGGRQGEKRDSVFVSRFAPSSVVRSSDARKRADIQRRTLAASLCERKVKERLENEKAFCIPKCSGTINVFTRNLF